MTSYVCMLPIYARVRGEDAGIWYRVEMKDAEFDAPGRSSSSFMWVFAFRNRDNVRLVISIARSYLSLSYAICTGAF